MLYCHVFSFITFNKVIRRFYFSKLQTTIKHFNLDNMKKIRLFILALLTIALFSACGEDEPKPTRLEVSITEHPLGGAQVSSVSARFNGTVTGKQKSIQVTVEWWWESGDHTENRVISSTQYVFDSDNTTSKSTVHSAGSGFILLNYYWIKITWTDDDGQHVLESNKAYCTS